MEALSLIKKMGNGKSIFSMSARYVNDEENAREMLTKFKDKFSAEPDCFVACFGLKVYKDFQKYCSDNNI